MSDQSYPITFFEIPVQDFDRAKTFYEAVTAGSLDTMDFDGVMMGFFPRGEYLGGAIVQGEGYVPSGSGTLVYLNAAGDLDGMLARVVSAGGKVVMPATSIGEFGTIARFHDTEGNLVAMHTM